MTKKDKLIILFALFVLVFSSLACDDTGGRVTPQDYRNNPVQAVQDDAIKAGNDIKATYDNHIAPVIVDGVYWGVCAGCNE